MLFQSAAFKGITRLERAGDNDPPLARGERGHAVAVLQAALIQLGYPMPLSSKPGGATDGIYGDETVDTVASFQSDATITIDGIAGHETLSRLDRRLPAAAPPKPAKPPAPPPAPSVPTPYPSSRDFKIGSDDPPMHADPGAGRWNSKPKSPLTVAAMAGILHVLPFARVKLGKDAVKHMEHYFDNDGKTLTMDVESMLTESRHARRLFLDRVNRIKDYIELLSPGTYYVTSRHGTGGYMDDTPNWYYAVGGYTAWVKGKADITDTGVCRLALEYRIYDRYNWDGHKATSISVPFVGDVTITDRKMAEFQLEGFAKEYDQVGTLRRPLCWRSGQPIPPAQLR